MKKISVCVLLFFSFFVLIPQELTAENFRVVQSVGLLSERTSINLKSIIEKHYPGYTEISDEVIRSNTVGARYTYFYSDDFTTKENREAEFKISYFTLNQKKKISFVSDAQRRSIEKYSIDSFQFEVAFGFLAIGYENRKINLYSEELGTMSHTERFPFIELEIPWMYLRQSGLSPIFIYKLMFAEDDTDAVKIGISYLF